MSNDLTIADRISGSIDRRVAGEINISSTGLTISSMSEAMELAKLMSVSGQAVPAHMRNNPGACLAVAIQAYEWGVTPFAIANKSYVVNDRLAYESALYHAVLQRRAPIIGRIKMEYIGDGASRQCRVSAKARPAMDGDPVETVEYLSPRISDIRPQNSPLWKNDPDQQLFYFSVRAFARRHFPDVMMGVYTEDELQDNPVTVTAENPRLKKQLDAVANGPFLDAPAKPSVPAPTPPKTNNTPKPTAASNAPRPAAPAADSGTAPENNPTDAAQTTLEVPASSGDGTSDTESDPAAGTDAPPDAAGDATTTASTPPTTSSGDYGILDSYRAEYAKVDAAGKPVITTAALVTVYNRCAATGEPVDKIKAQASGGELTKRLQAVLTTAKLDDVMETLKKAAEGNKPFDKMKRQIVEAEVNRRIAEDDARNAAAQQAAPEAAKNPTPAAPTETPAPSAATSDATAGSAPAAADDAPLTWAEYEAQGKAFCPDDLSPDIAGKRLRRILLASKPPMAGDPEGWAKKPENQKTMRTFLAAIQEGGFDWNTGSLKK